MPDASQFAAQSYDESLADLDAEQVLLAELMAQPSHYEVIGGIITAADFADPAHGLIFETVRDLDAGGGKVIFSRLAKAIGHRAELEDLGGEAYLTELLGNALTVLGPAGVKHHAEYIAALSHRRQLIDIACHFAEYAAHGTDKSVASQIAELEEELAKITARGGSDARSLSDAVGDALADYERAYTAGGGIQGLPTGFYGIDECLGGLDRGNVYVLAARPGMGKTALASNIAMNVAQADGSVALFSLEMPAKQIAGRLVCAAAQVPQHHARRGTIGPEDFNRLAIAQQNLARLRLTIDDASGVSPAYIRSKCSELRRKGGLDLVVIDYLQLMEPSTEKRNSNRNSEITAISKAVKDLAKACDVPVLILSQLNRAVETRDDKRPNLSDLRESGAIEQDADVVMFLYREEYYLRKAEPDPANLDAFDTWQAKMEQARGRAELDIAKNRHGPDARVQLRFHGPRMQFRDAEQEAAHGL